MACLCLVLVLAFAAAPLSGWADEKPRPGPAAGPDGDAVGSLPAWKRPTGGLHGWKGGHTGATPPFYTPPALPVLVLDTDQPGTLLETWYGLQWARQDHGMWNLGFSGLGCFAVFDVPELLADNERAWLSLPPSFQGGFGFVGTPAHPLMAGPFPLEPALGLDLDGVAALMGATGTAFEITLYDSMMRPFTVLLDRQADELTVSIGG